MSLGSVPSCATTIVFWDGQYPTKSEDKHIIKMYVVPEKILTVLYISIITPNQSRLKARKSVASV